MSHYDPSLPSQHYVPMAIPIDSPARYMNSQTTTLEESGSIFSQLDSMIAAVQVESNALDAMRERLKELDSMKSQLTSLTRRLLDADQSNLTLKSNMIKLNDSFTDLKRSKAELESTIPPMRQELSKTKDMYNKERAARLGLQEEASKLQNLVAQLRSANQDLEREYKTIPGLNDENESLRREIAQVRQRAKEEKMAMNRKLRALEARLVDAERTKQEMRQVATRLMEVVSYATDRDRDTEGTGGAAHRRINRISSLHQEHQQSVSGSGFKMASSSPRGRAAGGGGGGAGGGRSDFRSSIETSVSHMSQASLYDNEDFEDDEDGYGSEG